MIVATQRFGVDPTYARYADPIRRLREAIDAMPAPAPAVNDTWRYLGPVANPLITYGDVPDWNEPLPEWERGPLADRNSTSGGLCGLDCSICYPAPVQPTYPRRLEDGTVEDCRCRPCTRTRANRMPVTPPAPAPEFLDEDGSCMYCDDKTCGSC